MGLHAIKIEHPHVHLVHSMFLTLFSYFNIVTFISNKQNYEHTNSLYLFSIYVSIIFMLIDTFISSFLNISSILIHNILYISCLVNTVYKYGNLLSVILFLIESVNVTIDWVIVNIISKKYNTDMHSGNLKHNLLLVGVSIYAVVTKMIISPFVLIIIFYNLSGNLSEPVFILSFCLYAATIVKLYEELKYIAGSSSMIIDFKNKLNIHLTKLNESKKNS